MFFFFVSDLSKEREKGKGAVVRFAVFVLQTNWKNDSQILHIIFCEMQKKKNWNQNTEEYAM